MTNNLKLALLPAAVTAALFSGNVFAGTEACFEIYRGDATDGANRVVDFGTLFTKASCGDVRHAELQPLDPARVAFELTGGNDLELNDVNQDASNVAINLVYIPTTNLPTGTFVTMNLSENAVFGNNGDQLFLIKQVRDNQNATTEYVTVASTTGGTDESGEATFVVNSNAVEGGQRLILSRTSQIADQTDITSPVVRMNNESCPVDADIKISASATYNGVALIGGQTEDATSIVEAKRQFVFAQGLSVGGTNEATEGDVNSDADNLRTNFVLEVDTNGDFVTNVSSDRAVFETSFLNRAEAGAPATLDQYVELDASDRVGMNLAVNGNDPSATVIGQFYTNRTASAAPAVDNSAANPGLIDAAATSVDRADSATDTYALTAGNVQFDADEVFAAGQYDTRGAFLISNINEDTAMAYNYDLTSDFGLFFHNAAARKLIDQAYSCNDDVMTHKIGVNGAVLKVPYAYNGGGNWVRITNEFSQAATVTVEVIDENDAAGAIGEPKLIELSEARGFDKLNAYDSVKYDVPKIMTEIRREFGLAHSTRVSLTFTVTAPKNTVHGVSVLNTGGGYDRTMPVLDQNDWSE